MIINMNQKSTTEKAKEEFSPPVYQPRLRFYKFQILLSLPIIAIPVLALWGMFGETIDKIQSTQSPIEVTIEYPKRLRLKQRLPLSVIIKNISNENLEGLNVSFDKKYLDQFSDLSATPAFDSIYEVRLGALPPADVIEVNLEFQGQKYGSHEGNIRIQPKTGRPQTFHVKSFVFP